MFMFDFLRNGLKVVRGMALIAECAPGFLFHESVEIPKRVRFYLQVHDEAKGHDRVP